MNSEAVTVLYIGSFGRSGSTLLERMLGQIPGFFSIGEGRHVWDRSFADNQLCGCGEPFYACPFWRDVGSEAFGGLDRVDYRLMLDLRRSIDRHRFLPHHTWTLMTGRRAGRKMAMSVAKYSEVLERWYKAIRAVSGATVIVDASKDPPYAFLLQNSSYVDLRLLHLVRDSRAVAYSWSRRRIRPEIHHRRVYMPTFSPVKSSVDWNVYNYVLGFLSNTVGACTLLRYEDLVQRPADCVREVLHELGFGGDYEVPFSNDQRVTLHANHTIAGNPMRFRVGDILVEADEEWKYNMRLTDKTVATMLTCHLLSRYGYLHSLSNPVNRTLRSS